MCDWISWALRPCSRVSGRSVPNWDRLTRCQQAASRRLWSAACPTQCFIKSISGRHLYVGLDSRALPVRLGDRVYEAPEGHSDEEVTVDPVGCRRMGPSARGLTEEDRSLETLQVVAEFFPHREGSTGCEHVDRFASEFLARHIREGP